MIYLPLKAILDSLNKNKERSLEKILEDKQEEANSKNYSNPNYVKYKKENPLQEALRTRIDPITGALIERMYFFLFDRGVLGFYEPARHTITLPYAFEVGASTLYETLTHEISHGKGFTTEHITEENGQNMLKEYLK